MSDASPAAALLPPLVSRWVTELLGGPIPSETNATCSDCAMCRPADRLVSVSATTFKPDVKCCTYIPQLSNFTIGGILADPNTSWEVDVGRASIKRRIEARVGVTPFGLEVSPMYDLVYAKTKSQGFGRSRALKCPHFIDEGGLCGIWRHRNAVCSTFHCKFVRGAIGRHFWNRLLQLLSEVESCLKRWCVMELEVGDAALTQLVAELGTTRDGLGLTAAAIDGRVDESTYRRVWGDNWIGREHQFYTAAARLVEPLSWSDVLSISGVKLHLLARLTCDAYRELISDDIPPIVRAGVFSFTLIQPGFVALRSYSPDDQMIIPQSLLDILRLFDGQRTTEEVLCEAKRRGTILPRPIVRRLIDFAVLTTPAAEGISRADDDQEVTHAGRLGG